MQTIKFRAWHYDDGMLYFDLDTFIKDYHDQYGNIMQFTGLQDKNGADIYEGDILDGDGIVEWNDVEFCWSVKDKGYDGVDQWHSLQFKNCPIEITGNIHEGGINVL